MKNYTITSPAMHGDEVKTLQRRLAGDNTFKQNYKPGSIDGQFGDLTAAACFRAKWALGYSKAELKRTYGPTLDRFLTGKVELPDAYKRRRTDRKRAAAAIPVRAKALKEATKHIGVKESPAGSNRCQFSIWYGLIGPWCAMFATFCYLTAGSKSFKRGARYAYVPYIVSAARLGGRGFYLVSAPEPGDLVCYDWNGDGVSDHIGLFEKWNTDGSFTAIEGNTGVGNDSNGGQVMRRNRNRNQVQAFVRVAG